VSTLLKNLAAMCVKYPWVAVFVYVDYLILLEFAMSFLMHSRALFVLIREVVFRTVPYCSV